MNQDLTWKEKKEDEELRVCYVGVTRSKKELYLLELPGEYKNPFPPLQTYLGEKYDG